MTYAASVRTIKNKNGMTSAKVVTVNTNQKENMYISSEQIELELSIRGYLTTETWHEINDWLLRNLVPRDAKVDVIKGINTIVKVSWYKKKPEDNGFIGSKEFETGKKIIDDSRKPKSTDIKYIPNERYGPHKKYSTER